MRLPEGDNKAAKFEFSLNAGIDLPAVAARLHAMLQHNGKVASRGAHFAHAAVMGLHAMCCGLPALAMMAAALSGTASGAALLSDNFQVFHDFLHHYEAWILVLSAALVGVGGMLEIQSRRAPHAHGFPWLFSFSVLCFLGNAAIIVAHRAF